MIVIMLTLTTFYFLWYMKFIVVLTTLLKLSNSYYSNFIQV